MSASKHNIFTFYFRESVYSEKLEEAKYNFMRKRCTASPKNGSEAVLYAKPVRN